MISHTGEFCRVRNSGEIQFLNAHIKKGERNMKKFKKVLTILVLALTINYSVNAQHVLRATKYYAGHNCGWVTADGSRINQARVNNGQDRWVALSRDMFRIHGFKYGDSIRVESDNPHLNGIWKVKDLMGPKKVKSIDFLMPRDSKYFNNPCKVRIYKVRA